MNKPDWRKKEDYAYITPEEIGYHGVAWEFLRRNQSYQDDFQALINGTFTDAAGNPPIKITASNFLFHPELGFYDPPLKEGESESKWLARCLADNQRPRILTPERYVAEKWSLAGHMLDPDKTALEVEPEPRFKLAPVPRVILKWEEVLDLNVRDETVDEETSDATVMFDEENILVVFSLRERITPQWMRIKRRLTELQQAYAKEFPSPPPGSTKSLVWIPALRAWDAKNQEPDAPKKALTKELYKSSSWQATRKLHDHILSAQHLIDGRYRDIIRQGEQKPAPK